MNKSEAVSIILVEDEQDDAYIIKQLLSNKDPFAYRLIHVEDMAGLKQAISEFSADVILLDLGLTESKALTTLDLANSLIENIPIIVLTSYDDDEFGESAIQMGAQDYLPKGELSFHTLSRTIRFAIERFQLAQELKTSAHKDPLTGLNNRCAFNEYMTAIINKQQRYGEKFGLFYMGLDNFKPVNDELGHIAGDEVLKEIGQRFLHQCRKSDFVARVGGDEFVLVIPNFSTEQSLVDVAEKTIEVCERPIQVRTKSGLREVKVSISIGIVKAEANGNSTADSLVNRADAAMYKAKSESELAFVFAG